MWTAIVIVSYIIIYVATALHILLTMRGENDRAAMWLFFIFAIPVLGILCYVFWGMSRRNTFAARIEHLKGRLAGTVDERLQNILDKLNRRNSDFLLRERVDEKTKAFDYRVMLDRIFTEYPPLSGNEIKLLCDGDAAYPAMLEAINSAKHNINMQSFIIASDYVGKEIFDALKRKADEGVKVKVIYDSFGSFGAIIKHFFFRYSHRSPNMKIRAFSHLSLFTPWNMQLRNHRKLLVVDGKVAFIGGMNISADNFRLVAKTKNPIHDLHCRLRGPAVSELQLNFLSDWCFTSKEIPEEVFTDEYFTIPEKHGDNCVRVIPSGHGSRDGGSEQCFYTACASARRSLWIYTPYFVPDKSFVNALSICAERGVDVRILVPKNNNHFFMRLASKSLYEPLLESGVRIFERNGDFSHAKAMLVDSEWTLFGSSNCDVRSFRLNYELDLLVSGVDFIGQLYEQLVLEFAQSDEISRSEQHAAKRLLQNFCAMFTPIL